MFWHADISVNVRPIDVDNSDLGDSVSYRESRDDFVYEVRSTQVYESVTRLGHLRSAFLSCTSF